MRLLIAGGGTGGHVYPALAVARSIRARPDAPEVEWLGGRRGLEAELVPPAGLPFQRLVLRSLRSVERNVHLILDPLRLAASIPQAGLILARRRPAAIFTTGGYVAVPVALAARVLGIPVLLWEGNVVPGRSSRFIAPVVRAIVASWPTACEALAERERACYVTGTPIRETRSVDRPAARERLGIPAGARMLLVFGGSQAVRRLNAAVAEALPRLVERVHVVHVTGHDGYAPALAGREALPEPLRARYQPHPFLRDEMLDALAAADLVVGRAGASTLAETTALGVPIVVVPYPHAGGHQRANAEALAAAGAARIVEDEAFDGEALLDAARLLEDPAGHLAMSAAARSIGRPGAADAIADLLLALAERRPLPDAAAVDRRSRSSD
ncbi:MAG TPA: UDP-N-acetylglucosamine--N-acetylmuramyl-(pentapeptide) pyrophosphoryl-undecaprenol N-acetylglucosamine transferase [Gemmatimonadales bacterium]|nr:UDP-N-acetylglucosamine--N-acetylmuramyl-(pentapeptide) pyrophosphoryl-undecaprenol N-acetylglucosamine transferase [Gemmatimonadales bacterium]